MVLKWLKKIKWREDTNIQFKTKSQRPVNIYKNVQSLVEKEMKIKAIKRYHLNPSNIQKLRAIVLAIVGDCKNGFSYILPKKTNWYRHLGKLSGNIY